MSSLNIVECLWAWSSSSWAASGTARRSARAGRSRRTPVMITSGFRSMLWNQLVRVPDAEQTMALSVGPLYRNTSRTVGAGGQPGDPVRQQEEPSPEQAAQIEAIQPDRQKVQ